MQSRLAHSLVFGVCLLTSASAALGGTILDVKTETQLIDMKITVVDLDLSDGIEAGFRFADTPLRRSSEARVSDDRRTSYFDIDRNKNFGPATALAAVNLGNIITGTTRAAVEGPGHLELPTYVGVATDLSFMTSSLIVDDFNGSARIAGGSFTVTPNTRIVLTATFDSVVEFDADNEVRRWLGDVQAIYSGSLSMVGGLYTEAGQVGNISVWDSESARLRFRSSCQDIKFAFRQCADSMLSTSDMLTTTFETGAGQTFRGSLGASIGSQVRATAVPEPGSLALMLSGLAAVGFAAGKPAWRRRRTAAT